MIKVGLTGGIGSGKTFVSKIIENIGYPVFNSDTEAKNIMAHNENVIQQIKSLFGEESYINNELNRPFLAQLIFNDVTLKNQLNAIVHPAVHQAFDEFCELHNQINPSTIVFNEAAILFEIGRYKFFDYNVLVTAPKEIRIERVIKRDNISEEQVISRMNNQWEDTDKEKLADFIIVNDGEKPLKPQIDDIISSILRLSNQ